MKYDLETVRVGLKALGDAVESMFKNDAFGKDEGERISKNVFSHKCGITATDRKFESVAKQAAISLREIREVAAKQKLENAASQAAESLEKLQIASKEQGW